MPSSSRIISEALTAIMITGTRVLPEVIVGIEAAHARAVIEHRQVILIHLEG